MTTFSTVLKVQERLPGRHATLTSSMFADDWPERPADEIAVGLKRMADADLQTARAEAARLSIEMHDDREGQIEAFNDGLMRWAIVRGTCDPNDVLVPCALWAGSEENVRGALTSRGIRFLWDELERFHIETSPIVRQATPDDMGELADRIKDGALSELLSIGQRTRALKLLAFVLDELREIEPKDDADENGPGLTLVAGEEVSLMGSSD